MSENTLKIRINIQQSPQQAIEEVYPDLNEPEIEYEQSWDWKKIAMAISSLLVIVVLIGAILFNTAEIESSATKYENTVTGTDQANVSQDKESMAERQTIDQTTAANSANAPESSFSPIMAQPEVTMHSETATNSSNPVTTPAAKPKPEPKTLKLIVMPRRKPIIRPTLKQQDTSDYPQVIRAQLSHAIKAREPIDDIDTITLRHGESKSIYFYLHVKDLQKKKVNILWYRNDRLDSQLPLQIYTNNWRTNASKQLDHERLGAWRVELTDETGNRLATRHFTVTQY